MKIIYLHGFRSHYQNSSKVKYLKNRFGENFISYLENLRKIVKDILTKYVREQKMFIGTSLGGFYANFLSNLFSGHTLLINPIIKPHIHMKNNYYQKKLSCFSENSKSICIDKNAISEFKKIFADIENNNNHSLSKCIWLGKNDSLVTNLQEIYEYFEHTSTIYFFDDNHRFEKFESCFDKWFPQKLKEIEEMKITDYDCSVIWIELACEEWLEKYTIK